VAKKSCIVKAAVAVDELEQAKPVDLRNKKIPRLKYLLMESECFLSGFIRLDLGARANISRNIKHRYFKFGVQLAL